MEPSGTAFSDDALPPAGHGRLAGPGAVDVDRTYRCNDGSPEGLRRTTGPGMSTSPEPPAVPFHENAGFLATNLLPEHTGVEGAVLWVFAGEFSRADAQHGPRVLVVPGHEPGVATLIDAVAVTIASPPGAFGGLPEAVKRQVVEWVERNRDVLLKYWQGEMATNDALDLLVRV